MAKKKDTMKNLSCLHERRLVTCKMREAASISWLLTKVYGALLTLDYAL
jgi:hypothetical protein